MGSGKQMCTDIKPSKRKNPEEILCLIDNLYCLMLFLKKVKAFW